MIANKILFVLSCVLCIVSLCIISQLEFKDYKLTRIITVLSFLPFVFYYKINKKLFIVFLLFIVFEVLLYDIEIPIFSKVAIALRGITYLVIASLIRSYLKFNANKKFPVTIVLAVIIIGYMLYSLIQLVDEELMTPLHRGIVVVSCLFIVIACVVAINYNFIKFSVKSTLFLVFVYCFALSDVTAFCGFYLDFDLLYYLERILALIGYPSFFLFASYSQQLRQKKSSELKSLDTL